MTTDRQHLDSIEVYGDVQLDGGVFVQFEGDTFSVDDEQDFPLRDFPAFYNAIGRPAFPATPQANLDALASRATVAEYPYLLTLTDEDGTETPLTTPAACVAALRADVIRLRDARPGDLITFRGSFVSYRVRTAATPGPSETSYLSVVMMRWIGDKWHHVGDGQPRDMRNPDRDCVLIERDGKDVT